MRSYVREVPHGEAFQSDKSWFNVVLIREELSEAIGQDRVRAFIREVLRSKYAALQIFESIVDEVTRSVLLALAALVAKRETGWLSILLHESDIERWEKLAKERCRQIPSTANRYWIGEAKEIER